MNNLVANISVATQPTLATQVNIAQQSWDAIGVARHRVSVVIPARNEAKNLPYVLPRIPFWVHEVILVDGNSTDGTADVARALIPTIRVVGQDGKGKGNALRAGFAACTGDIIVMLDADGSTDPAEIPSYVGALFSGADFAKGTRFIQGGGTSDMEFHRKAGNWGLTALVRILFGGNYLRSVLRLQRLLGACVAALGSGCRWLRDRNADERARIAPRVVGR